MLKLLMKSTLEARLRLACADDPQR